MKLRKSKFYGNFFTDGIMYLKPVRILWERKSFRKQVLKICEIRFIKKRTNHPY